MSMLNFIPIPGFSERAPDQETKQGIIDIFAELFEVVNNTEQAAEASHAGVTQEPIQPLIEAETPQMGEVVSLDPYRAERDLGKGTIVAAADIIRHQAATQGISISEALANVMDAHDHPERYRDAA